MIDVIILTLAVICVCVFLKTVIEDFRGNGKPSCGGRCSGCKFEKKCKDLKK